MIVKDEIWPEKAAWDRHLCDRCEIEKEERELKKCENCSGDFCENCIAGVFWLVDPDDLKRLCRVCEKALEHRLDDQ